MSYQYVDPTEDQKTDMQIFRNRFQELHDDLVDTQDSSRGLSLCLTKLEEASFWLNKAITKNDQ